MGWKNFVRQIGCYKLIGTYRHLHVTFCIKFESNDK